MIANVSSYKKNNMPAKILAYLAILLFFMLLIVFWQWMAIVQYSDSLIYAHYAKTGSVLFHPHHLLYPAILRVFYLAFGGLNICTDLCSSQVHSAIWGAAAAVGLWLIMRHLMSSIAAAFIAAAFLVASAGFWTWATQVEAYVPALGCQVVLAALLITNEGKQPSRGLYLTIAFLLALSVMYHQAAVLFVVPMLIYMLLSLHKDGIVLFVKISVLSGIFVLSCYALAFLNISSDFTLSGFYKWILSYGISGHDWGRVNNFSFDGLAKLYKSQALNILILPSYLNLPEAIIYNVISALLAIVLAWNIYSAFSRTTYVAVRAFFLIWILTQTLFLLWWLPGLRQFIISNTVALIALTGLAVIDLFNKIKSPFFRYGLTACFSFFLLCLVFLNYVTVIRPQHSSPDWSYRAAARLNLLLPHNCALVDDWGVGLNMQYYFDWQYYDINALLLKYYSDQDMSGTGITPSLGGCALIPMRFFDPDYSVAKGVDGRHNSRAWIRFANHILGIKWNADSEWYTRYELKSISTGRDGVYFAINRLKNVQIPKKDDYIAVTYNGIMQNPASIKSKGPGSE